MSRVTGGTSVLDFFQASPDEYAVIFTSNASHALKLVGEAYPFQPGGQFLLLFDNHNSVERDPAESLP